MDNPRERKSTSDNCAKSNGIHDSNAENRLKTKYHEPNLFSKAIESTTELIKTFLPLFDIKRGKISLILTFTAVVFSFLFVIVLIPLIIALSRQNFSLNQLIFLISVLCTIFLVGPILLLALLKRIVDPQIGKTTTPEESIDIKRESIHTIMRMAKQSLLISGHTLRKFTKEREGEQDKVKTALSYLWGKGVDVTLILLHPESPYAEAQKPFHCEETTEAEEYREQIEEAIKYCIEKGNQEEHFSVYLSYYKPPFRTIIIDNPEYFFSNKPLNNIKTDSKCYIDLYMFGEDVEKTPRILFQEGSEGYSVINNSIKQLCSSSHVVPLIEKGTIYKNWRDCGLSHVLHSCIEKGCQRGCTRCDLVNSALLGNQNQNYHSDRTQGICSEKYRPGTFTLSQLERYKHLLDVNGNFRLDKWVRDAVLTELSGLKDTTELKQLIKEYGDNEIIKKVQLTFEIGPVNFNLAKSIWCQEYSDIIRRIILTYVHGNPDLEINWCKNLTTGSKDLILEVIDILKHSRSHNKLPSWLDFSVIAGLLGIDIKPYRTATSPIKGEVGIVLREGKDVSIDIDAHRIAEKMIEIQEAKSLLKEGEAKVDDSKEFFKILDNTNHLNLVSFPDDYLETIFLLKYYEVLLKEYYSVSIHIIPRSIRCGNDVTTNDINEMLEYFPSLKNSGRFFVVENGPKIGGVNLEKASKTVVQGIMEADLLDVRGARNYEMMQRINREAFFGFMVVRRISEAVTGLPQSEKSFFYRYQKAEECTFKSDWDKAFLRQR